MVFVYFGPFRIFVRLRLGLESNTNTMKRLLFPLVAALCLFILWGCPKEEKEQPVLTPIQTSYEIGYQGGSVSISFKTNQQYTVKSSDPSWLKVSQPTKAVTTESVAVTASENSSENSRTANITVTAGTLSATFTVTQAGKPKDPGPEPPTPEDPDKLENAGQSTFTVYDTGGDITVKVRSNVEYQYNWDADWITTTKAGATRVDELTFHVAANTGAERTATITFTYNNELSFGVTVKQLEYVEPGEDPRMELSVSEISAIGGGGEFTVDVDANYDYDVSVGVSWIHYVKTDTGCIITVDSNPGEDSRSAKIRFSCDEIIREIKVDQEGSAAGGDPFDVGSNLSDNGTANCYVVIKAGDYSFDVTVMGNGPDGFIWEDKDAFKQNLYPTMIDDVSFSTYGSDGPSQVKVIWNDGDVVNNVTIDKDNLKVHFTATGNKGNALIGVYDRSNTLLWSWHIWCTDSPKRIRHEALNGYTVAMLDRNLGATSCNPADGSATYGYWYQFGRKDPLKLYHGVVDEMVAGDKSMEYSIMHPTEIIRVMGKDNEWFNGDVKTITADLWGNPYALHNGADHLYVAPVDELKKTIYDPCPPGYMVPPEWAWDTFSLDNCEVGANGLTFAELNGNSFYPFAGYGDSGDQYGRDNGWYGYPGYTPNNDGQKYHHNCRNVVCCWSSGSEHAFLRSGHEWDLNNYHHSNQFLYMQDEEASDNYKMVNESSQAHLYTKYGHIRQRCCSVRCMKMP